MPTVTGRLVEVKPSATVEGVAGIDPRTKAVHVVLGRDGRESAPVEVEFRKIAGKVRVLAQRIPDKGWKALESPEIVLNEDYGPEQGILRVMIPELGPSDACLITLSLQ